MKGLTRRDLLKTSLMAPAAVAVARQAVANGKVAMDVPGEGAAAGALPAGATPDLPGPRTGRERLLLDFGWRFHFGNANDPAKDFGFGDGDSGNFQKTGNFLPAGALAFDDNDWRSLIFLTIGRSSCPLKTTRRSLTRDFTRWDEPTRPRVSDGIAASLNFPTRTRVGGSQSSSMAPIGKPWWSSTVSTSGGTAADTIRSASM